MDLIRRREGEVEVVALRGRLDAFTSAPIEQQILALVEAGAHQLIVDMAAVDYASSVGLRLLLKAARRLRDLGGRFAVSALQPTVREAFEFSGLATLFPAFSSTEEAIERLS